MVAQRTKVTLSQKATIFELATKRYSNGAIAVALGIPVTRVSWFAAKARKDGMAKQPETRGRPALLGPRDVRALVRLANANRFLSAAALTRVFNRGRPVPVSRWTVRRALLAQGFKSAIPARKPFVSDKNQTKRRAWARTHKHWGAEWEAVLFTDESSFEVRTVNKRARVWRRAGERFTPACLQPTFKSGRQSVMVWGGFSARGRTPLVLVKGSMNSTQYEGVLGDSIFHHIMAYFGAPDAAWLQEDLAPCHASKYSRDVKAQLGFKCLPWVGQSPDLNPIENAWDELKRRLAAREEQPGNKEDLYKVLCEEWEAIPDAFFARLVDSMKRRVRCVIAAKGMGTKY